MQVLSTWRPSPFSPDPESTLATEGLIPAPARLFTVRSKAVRVCATLENAFLKKKKDKVYHLCFVWAPPNL